MSSGDVVRQFFGAMASGNMESAKALVHEDFVMEWPQSGERFRGRDNAFAAMSVQVDRPNVEGDPRIVGSGDVWVAQMRLRYASGLSHYVAVLEFRGDKLARGTGYFASPFPAQQYRERFADKA
jgi:ketosteroid isomerase-like protein